jgi:hypothetical protein
MAIDDLIEKAKDSATTITDKISELTNNLIGDESKAIIDEFKDAGTNKVKEVVDMIEASKIYITRAGYELSSLHISLGLPPQIGLSFKYQSEVSVDDKKKLLEEVEERKVLSVILKCLFKAGDFYKSAKFKEYKLGSVNISLGLTPGVNVNFVK